MTPEAQRMAIAEACGYECSDENPTRYSWWESPKGYPRLTHNLPDYLNDLNAMHAGVKEQSSNFQKEFALALSARAGAIHQYVHQLTAQDWAHCFLFILQSKRDSLKINA